MLVQINFLLGINIYAEGHLSLELQNIGGDGKSYGAREKFKNALEVINDGIPEVLVNEIKSNIARSLEQYELVDILVKSDNEDFILKSNESLVDLQFYSILKGRAILLTTSDKSVFEVIR